MFVCVVVGDMLSFRCNVSFALAVCCVVLPVRDPVLCLSLFGVGDMMLFKYTCAVCVVVVVVVGAVMLFR